jgi:hypothetical protein
VCVCMCGVPTYCLCVWEGVPTYCFCVNLEALSVIFKIPLSMYNDAVNF